MGLGAADGRKQKREENLNHECTEKNRSETSRIMRSFFDIFAVSKVNTIGTMTEKITKNA
jgi:hypothetical protein